MERDRKTNYEHNDGLVFPNYRELYADRLKNGPPILHELISPDLDSTEPPLTEISEVLASEAKRACG